MKDGKHGKCHHGKHRRKHGWWHALEKRAEAFGEGLEDRAEKLVGDKGALAALGSCLCISAGILAAWLLHRRCGLARRAPLGGQLCTCVAEGVGAWRADIYALRQSQADDSLPCLVFAPETAHCMNPESISSPAAIWPSLQAYATHCCEACGRVQRRR